MSEMKIEVLSRRAFLAGAVGLAGGGLALVAGTANAAPLPSLKDLGYRATPNGSETCANCALFRQPNLCSGATGSVSPQGWCTIWKKKDV
ncbi:MAG: hypothetical protein U1E56_04850 [Bauldia sp.]